MKSNGITNKIMAGAVGLAALVSGTDASAAPKNCRNDGKDFICTLREPTRILTYHECNKNVRKLCEIIIYSDNKVIRYSDMGCKGKVTSYVLTNEGIVEEILARTKEQEEQFAQNVDPTYTQLKTEARGL